MRVPILNFSQAVDEEKAQSLPIRTEEQAHDNNPPPPYSDGAEPLGLHLHPLPAQDALLVKIQPPRAPAPPADGSATAHVPCDIVLVIDVSGSMSAAANVPGEEDEATGLSVLDLVKHAAKTIVETMDPRDRLGIVTFGARSTIVQRLLAMTDANKDKARANVDSMHAGGATNLWHGILDGFKLFENAPKSSNVPAIMVLTDGLPNHMCPSVGYIPKLRTMMPFPGSIHTFGFGYRLRSGLLKSVAEVGGGNYAFIPDAGMIGTVFVHAVANLQATFAVRATLRLEYPLPLQLEDAMGISAEKTPPAVDDGFGVLDIQLGNLQYGQSRDILLRVRDMPSTKELEALPQNPHLLINASLMFSRAAGPILQPSAGWSLMRRRGVDHDPPSRIATSRSMLDPSDLPAAEVAYHESRARLCSFLSSIFPFGTVDFERRAKREPLRKELAALIDTIPARAHADALNQSLMEDLTGDEPRGQISLAILNDGHFQKWGVHYLLSYLNAHTRQICNSFKDAGPLQYGTDSPLFCACRTRLDTAFDSLPAPTPSLIPEDDSFTRNYSSHGGPRKTGASFGLPFRPISMSRYNRSGGSCFAGSTPVELASGKRVRIASLRRGMKLRTPEGPRRVALVLKTPVENQILCRVGSLLVTPWHPITIGDDAASSSSWCFPATVADNPVRYSGAVYSVLLQRDRSASAHAIRVADTWGVTLGHGIVAGSSSAQDVRAHEFLGDWDRVAKALTQLRPSSRGAVEGSGVQRDERSGRVCGFKAGAGKERTPPRQASDVLEKCVTTTS
ncbi:Inter-alpha-trypsin inhibitor heavy chain H3 [Paramyrothecium foliicola]|nr:Inter-alpha-trypsin inhibitor heavy chain H3 [Paramyrothecium foliicola]